MSRTFSLYLIAMGIVLSGSLLSVHFYLVTQARSEVANYSQEANLRVLGRQHADLEIELMKYQEDFEDESKNRFFPLLKICTSIREATKEYDKITDDIFHRPEQSSWTGKERKETIIKIRKAADLQLNKVANTASQVFREHHLSFDLTEEDIEPKLAFFDKVLERAISVRLNSAILSKSEVALHLQLITLSFNTALQDILQESLAIGCYRKPIFDQFYPVVINPTNRVPLGSTQEFSIAIGSYTTKIDPTKTDIRVNGQRLNINNRGLAVFPVKGNKAGKHLLRLSSIVIHSDSGDTSRSESLFQYVVE